jgi:hypothetical protein
MNISRDTMYRVGKWVTIGAGIAIAVLLATTLLFKP